MSQNYAEELFRVVAERNPCGVLNRARDRAVLLVGDANQVVYQLARLVALRRIREREVEPHANLRQTRCSTLVYTVTFYVHIKRSRLRAPGRHHVHIHCGTPRDSS